MPRIHLEKPPIIHRKQAPWKESFPFVENTRAQLVHRIRYGSTYGIHKKPHIAVHYWCGMAATASDGKLTFVEAPNGDKPLCLRCEEIAVKKGQVPADILAGKHVHKGRTVAVITCCQQGE